MGQIGSMWYNIGAKTADLEKGLASSKSKLGGLGTSFQSVTGISLSTAGAVGLVAAALQKTIQFFMECEQAANESALADAKLEAVLKSTGGQAGVTSSQMKELADSMSKATGIDDEMIVSAEAVMLTFTKINKDVFPETIKLAGDMAAVLGGDLQGKVTMVGKAMNDFTGYTALKRAGVSFTEEQINQIENFKESNDLIGYQKLIMAELATEYGGAAEAMSQAGDASDRLKLAQENYKEAVGESLVGLTRKWKEYRISVYETLTTRQELENEAAKIGYARMPFGGYQNVNTREFKTTAEIQSLVATNKTQITQIEKLTALYSTNGMVWDTTINQWIKGTGQQITLTDEMIAQIEKENNAITKMNEDNINQVKAWTDIEQDHSDKLEEFHNKSFDLFLKLKDLKDRGYSEESKEVQEIRGQLGEINQSIQEEMDAYQLKTNTVILGYMQEKMAADGVLDDKETEWLIAKGVEWGVYADNALQAYRDASAAADDFLKHRNAAEGDNTVYVDYVVRGGGGNSQFVIPKPGEAKNQEKATGGYGSGLTLVGERGPELVNLPYGSYVNTNSDSKNMMSGNRDLLNAINMMSSKLDRLPLQLRDAILLA